MHPSIAEARKALASITLAGHLEETAITRVLCVYPLDYMHSMCIDIYDVPSQEVAKVVTKYLAVSGSTYTDTWKLHGTVYAGVMRVLMQYQATMHPGRVVAIYPVAHANMGDCSGVICTSLRKASDEYAPTIDVYSEGVSIHSGDVQEFLLEG